MKNVLQKLEVAKSSIACVRQELRAAHTEAIEAGNEFAVLNILRLIEKASELQIAIHESVEAAR